MPDPASVKRLVTGPLRQARVSGVQSWIGFVEGEMELVRRDGSTELMELMRTGREGLVSYRRTLVTVNFEALEAFLSAKRLERR